MAIDYYHVNAFTNRLFTGNPAAVCVLPEWLATDALQQIAIENNLPVTAFIVRNKNNYAIRWITPDYELDLCGHGTLAASFVIFNYLEPTLATIELEYKAGHIQVTHEHPWIAFVFPEKTIAPIPIPSFIKEACGADPIAMYGHNNERVMIVFENAEIIRKATPNLTLLKQLDYVGFTLTAKGNEVDFVSRTFYPKKSIPYQEDAVTGAAHCLLAPYWANELNKNILRGNQVSTRGGFLECEVLDKKVILKSQAILYLQGSMSYPNSG